jgi:ABC-type lipoprotein export system ATPase subunit
MAMGLSTLRASLAVPPGRFLILISVSGSGNSKAMVLLEGLYELKTSNDLIGIKIRSFPACRIEPQAPTLRRALLHSENV